jgi:predicted MPP superfamily phosphohydrolase
MSSVRALARLTAGVGGAGAALGAGLTAYAVWEARQYTLRRVSVPVLPAGARPLRVLHLSDLHLTPGQTRKQEWLAGLATLRPDLVVDTGDNLAHAAAVPVVRDALGTLLDAPGVFVFGSNDYFRPSLRNPLRYLLPDDGRRHTDVEQLPWRDLRTTFTDAGWVDLTNRRATVRVGDLTLAFAGVDDPHLSYDRLDEVAGPADEGADLRLGVAHAPYLRVLDQFAADGYDAILAGHTHGGQVCLPGGRALTTNCDLDPARARGLHRHPARSRPGDPGSSWLHVSAGLGTSPYTRIRVACRPEATLLTLVPGDWERA